MEDLLGEIELRVKLEEKKELLQKLRRKEIQQAQEAQNSLNESPSTVNNGSVGKRSDPPDSEKIKQRVEAIKRKAWCLGETLHMEEGTAHQQKKRKFHSIPLVTPNDSSHASITLNNDENIVHVIVKRAQPEFRRGTPIEEDNKGHQLLKRVGWRENSGLGRKENGIIEPLIPIVQNSQKGLGSKTKQDTQVHNFCEVCNKIIPEASWASHLNGKKHKHRVHYVQMLEQLAPHLLPEERHQLLDEDEESNDDENSTREIINTDANNSTTVNNISNNTVNNGQSSATIERQNSENLNPTHTVTLTTSAIATNNTLHPKFVGPMPKPVPVYGTTSNQTNAPKATAAQLAQPVGKLHQAPGQTAGDIKPPLLAPVPLPPEGNHQWLLCDVCKIHMYPQNWDMHINGKVHQKNLKKLVAEKQLEEEKAKVHLLPEETTPPMSNASRRPYRGRGQLRSFRGQRNNARYSASQYQQPPGEEYYDQSYQNAPLYPPPPQFLHQQHQADPRYSPHANNNSMPVAPPGTTAVVSMIRDIIAQRIGSLQQQQRTEAKQPDPSRIFEY